MKGSLLKSSRQEDISRVPSLTNIFSGCFSSDSVDSESSYMANSFRWTGDHSPKRKVSLKKRRANQHLRPNNRTATALEKTDAATLNFSKKPKLNMLHDQRQAGFCPSQTKQFSSKVNNNHQMHCQQLRTQIESEYIFKSSQALKNQKSQQNIGYHAIQVPHFKKQNIVLQNSNSSCSLSQNNSARFSLPKAHLNPELKTSSTLPESAYEGQRVKLGTNSELIRRGSHSNRGPLSPEKMESELVNSHDLSRGLMAESGGDSKTKDSVITTTPSTPSQEFGVRNTLNPKENYFLKVELMISECNEESMQVSSVFDSTVLRQKKEETLIRSKTDGHSLLNMRKSHSEEINNLLKPDENYKEIRDTVSVSFGESDTEYSFVI